MVWYMAQAERSDFQWTQFVARNTDQLEPAYGFLHQFLRLKGNESEGFGFRISAGYQLDQGCGFYPS